METPPELLQVAEPAAELRRRQPSALTHPSQGRRRLDVCDRDRAYAVCLAIGELRLLGAGLIDQQLDQGAGIEVEAQRRPSAT
jgi:hypothetical protein